MVEFVNLKLIQIQLQIYFSEGKCLLLVQSNHHPFFVVTTSQLTASPKAQAAARLLLGVNRVALLQLQASGAEHSRAGSMWRAF